MVLNHYAINQVVGGKMTAGPRLRFGSFGLLKVTGTALANLPRPSVKVAFDVSADRIVFNAFLEVYDGLSPESLILHDAVAKRFHSLARKNGFHASDADMNRRLINIRKNPARYSKHGIVIPPATKTDPHPSIVPRYAHLIEIAVSRLRSRYGVTIDDIIIDPACAREYEAMVRPAAPELTSLELRLAAMYVRKTRYIAKAQGKIVAALNSNKIDAKFIDLGPLDQIKSSDVASGEGLVEILENGRYLYISRNEDLRSSVQSISSDATLKFMANEFWEPDPHRLAIRIFPGHSFMKAPLSQWQLKLISDKKPVFNYPVAAK